MDSSAWQLTPAVVIFVGVALALIIATSLCWRHALVPGGRWAIATSLVCALWTIAHALQMGSASPAASQLLSQLEFAITLPIPASFLLFSLKYAGREQSVTRQTLLLMSAEPLLMLLLLSTNEAHGLIWRQPAVSDLTTGWATSLGVVYWVHAAYCWAVLLFATRVLVGILVRARHTFGLHAGLLVIAVNVPWALNGLWIAATRSLPPVEPTLLSCSLISLALVYGFSRLRSGDIVSLSRRVVMQSMSDGLMLLDTSNRIIDMNAAAQAMIGDKASGAVGQPIEQILPEWSEGLPRLHSSDYMQHIGKEITLSEGETKRTYDIRITPLTDWHGCLVSRVVTMRDISERKTLERELADRYEGAAYLAERDSLTGLLNHGGIHRRLEEEVSRAHRYGRQLSFLIIDLDDFKLFNDTYGHPAADRVLVQVSRLLLQLKRGPDILGRYGGDEFVAILPETDAQGAMAMAERLRAALASNPYIAPNGLTVPVCASLGIATYPQDASTAQALVAHADANLYESKQQDNESIMTGQLLLREGLVRAGSFGVLDGLVTTVHRKDRYTRRHSEDVTNYAISLARALGLSEEDQRTLRIAGLLHDVGKIAVPDRILRKPGLLSEAEYAIVKQHTAFGKMIIKDVPNLQDVLAAVAAHHERVDGRGYPNGLRGEDIPLLARILAIADTYSAITSDRPYRAARSAEEARNELLRVAGSQLDPRLVEVFLSECLVEDGIATVRRRVVDVFSPEDIQALRRRRLA